MSVELARRSGPDPSAGPLSFASAEEAIDCARGLRLDGPTAWRTEST